MNDDDIGAELEAQHFDPAQRSRGMLLRAVGGELGFRTRLIGRLNVAAAWLLNLDRAFVYVGDGGFLRMVRSPLLSLSMKASINNGPYQILLTCCGKTQANACGSIFYY